MRHEDALSRRTAPARTRGDSQAPVPQVNQQIQFRKRKDSLVIPESRDWTWLEQSAPRPTNARVYITELCNSRCLTCSFWKGKEETQLETDVWMRILRRMRGVGISSLEFVGGEPTLRTDLPMLVTGAREAGYENIIISSNGLLSAEQIARLISCGVNGFNISLDGMRTTYRFIRGRDWFERVVQAISSIVKAGIPVLVLTNLTRQVLGELEELVELTCRLGARWGLNIVENLKYGFTGMNLNELAIVEPSDIKKAEALLTRIQRRHPIACILRDVDIRYIVDYLRDPRREAKVPCTLGFSDVYLDPRGHVYSACMSLPSVANALDAEWAEIIDSPQMRDNLKSMLLRQCGGCTCGYAQRAERMYGFPGV